MGMSDFVIREAIIPQLAASTKEEVIREMVLSLREAGFFQNGEVEEVVRAVMRREEMGSTGIGHCIAIPHAKHARVERLIGTVAISSKGVDFKSIDREPVHVFVMLISPPDQPGPHLRALENVVRVMRQEPFVRRLRQAETVDDIWRLLDESANHWE